MKTYNITLERNIGTGLWDWRVSGVAAGDALTKKGARRQIARTIKEHRALPDKPFRMTLNHDEPVSNVLLEDRWK